MSCIRITLLSDLCSGSGESRGNAVDSDIAIDRNGFPLIPARRIKGVLSETAYDLLEKVKNLKDNGDFTHINPANIEKLFGTRFGTEGTMIIRNAELEHADAMKYWLNHQIPETLKDSSNPANISTLFAYVRGQTKIDGNGIADHGSLRFTRVVSRYNPFDHMKNTVFVAPVLIQDPNNELEKLLEDCCKGTRHIGTHRNRGLGNVRIEFIHNDHIQESETPVSCPESEEPEILTYRVRLDSPLIISGADGSSSSIPARSVIGCLASSWLKITGKSADEPDFQDLFLNGTVSWSALTPCCSGKPAVPVPLAVTKLKNAKKENGDPIYANRLSSEAETYRLEKQSTLEGRFLGCKDNQGWAVLSVPHKAEYHHRHEHTGRPFAPEEQLYMQEYIDEGIVFGGTVRAPKKLSGVIRMLLQRSILNFGRSKSAQYGNCSLIGEVLSGPVNTAAIRSSAGERVYAILESDLVFAKNGRMISDAAGIKNTLTEMYPLQNSESDASDYCAFHTIGGYHAMWHLQKPVIQTMAGGSCLQFISTGGELPELVRVGEFGQEGFGLIRFFTDKQMEKLTNIGEAMADTALEEKENAASVDGLKHALILDAAEKRIRKAANQWYDSVFRPNGKPDKRAIELFNPGRFRLMLDQSEELDGLIGKIMSIPLSDAGAFRAGHRDTYTNLVNQLYGREKTPESRIRHMLFSEDTSQGSDLYRLIMDSPDLKNKVLDLWKLPLATVLYRMHYEQKGDVRS